jgi:hypothetical protein
MGTYILDTHDNAKNLRRRRTKKSGSQEQNNTKNGLNPQEIEIRINNDES